MERIVFKNEYLNIVFGSLLIIFAVVVYFANYIEDILPYVIGILLILLSIKRFIYTFKKIISKNATLILIVELMLDFVFAGLLIYLQDHVELFVGLIVYIRGVSYLLINYIATRKVKIVQYLFNIGYVTIGAFLMFTSYNSVTFLSVAIVTLLIIVGGIYLQFGIRKLVVKEKKKEFDLEQVKKKEKAEKIETKSGKKIEELKEEIEKVTDEQKKATTQKKEIEKTLQKTEPKVEAKVEAKVQPKPEVKVAEKPKEVPVSKPKYESMTIAELKVIAKERKITGISQLNKAEIIAKLKK